MYDVNELCKSLNPFGTGKVFKQGTKEGTKEGTKVLIPSEQGKCSNEGEGERLDKNKVS